MNKNNNYLQELNEIKEGYETLIKELEDLIKEVETTEQGVIMETREFRQDQSVQESMLKQAYKAYTGKP